LFIANINFKNDAPETNQPEKSVKSVIAAVLLIAQETILLKKYGEIDSIE